MVENVITTAGPNVPVKTITASRGKAVRAEPIAALYAQGKVCHVGRFPQLEEQMLNMASAGYVGAKSPDRLAWSPGAGRNGLGRSKASGTNVRAAGPASPIVGTTRARVRQCAWC